MSFGKPQGAPADFLIKQKDNATGKNKIVGRGWKKKSQFGEFISLSIGSGEQRQSYIMVEADNTLPPKQAIDDRQWDQLKKEASPPAKSLGEILDDEIDDL